MQTLLAAIADDFTGGSDLAGMLASGGVRTLQIFGLATTDTLLALRGRAQAAVLSLKSRSTEPDRAILETLQAQAALSLLEPRQWQFKYCSTFDSTAQGNIGPVTDALLSRLGESFTIAVPALPVNGRTQYLGHLFVNGELLSESPMRHHPLNPMTDSNLVRFLQTQTRRRCGLVSLNEVRSGSDATLESFKSLASDGIEIALVDATEESDLDTIARASATMRLVTGGSGIGRALAQVWRDEGWIDSSTAATRGEFTGTGTLIASGSCSAATLTQLGALRRSGVDPVSLSAEALMKDFNAEIDRLCGLLSATLETGEPTAFTSSSSPAERDAQSRDLTAAGFDPSNAPALLEKASAAIVRRIAGQGLANKIIVAGGETSGAVIESLGVRAAEVLCTIDPGVPALQTLLGPPLRLALKSGNFGCEDFFLKAARILERQ